MTVFVSSVEDLHNAIAQASGGDTILLESGTYDNVNFSANTGVPGGGPPVTIKSADPDTPAVIERLVLSEVSDLVFDTLVIEELQADAVADLTFENILFDYDAEPGADTTDKPFDIQNGADITIRDSLFDGDVAEGVSAGEDGVGTGFGLRVGKSTGVLIEDNEFSTFHMGIQVSGEDIVIRGNDIHSMRCDGIRVNRADHVLIEDNYIHDFIRTFDVDPRDHSDMIQLWTLNAEDPLTNITIRNNVLDIGEGDFTQSIFMRNEAVDTGAAGDEMFYQDVEISGNLVINAQAHGIRVGETNGLVIRDNMVVQQGGGTGREGWGTLPSMQVSAASVDVTVEGNVVYQPIEAEDGEGWIVGNNAMVQNVNHKGYGYYSTAEDLIAGSQWQSMYEAKTHKTLLSGVPLHPVLALQMESPAPQPPPGGTNNLGQEDAFQLDVSPQAGGYQNLVGNVSVDPDGESFVFEGGRGAVMLGQQPLADANKISVEMKYTFNAGHDVGGELLNNHMRLSIAADTDRLVVRVATEDEGYKSYVIEDIAHAPAGVENDLVVFLDRVEDRLQVVLNGEVLIDDIHTDFNVPQGYQHGWTLGNKWVRSIDGEISEASFSTAPMAQYAFELSPVEQNYERIVGAVQVDQESGRFTFSEERGVVDLGQLEGLDAAPQMSFGLKYALDRGSGDGFLLNNHMRFAIAVENDRLVLRAATQDEGFKKFVIEDVAHIPEAENQLFVFLDCDEDRLQAVLDGEIVLDETGSDFVQPVAAYEWGWTIGDGIEGQIWEVTLSNEDDFY